MPRLESESGASAPSAEAKAKAKPRLKDLLQQLRCRSDEFPEDLLTNLCDSILIWLERKRAAKAYQ